MVKTQLWGESTYTVCILAPKTALKWKVKKKRSQKEENIIQIGGKVIINCSVFHCLVKNITCLYETMGMKPSHVLCENSRVLMPKLRHGNLSHTH